MAGENQRARKKAKPVEFSIFNADHAEELNMPSFRAPELREFMTSASGEDVLSLFSGPLILKDAGWLGAPPVAPQPVAGGDQAAAVPGSPGAAALSSPGAAAALSPGAAALSSPGAAAALSPEVSGQAAAAPSPPAPWLEKLYVEVQHFRALYGGSAQKAAGERAALLVKDTGAAQQLAEQASGAFPVGWVRTHKHADLPPDLVEQLAPSMPGNGQLILFEKGYLASLRVATSGGTRRVIQARFTDVGKHVREVKDKTDVPNGTDTFEWLMHEATADGVKDMLGGGGHADLLGLHQPGRRALHAGGDSRYGQPGPGGLRRNTHPHHPAVGSHGRPGVPGVPGRLGPA